MKELVYILNYKFGGILKKFYRAVYGIATRGELYEVRRNIRKRVGKELFCEAKEFRIAVLPNQLWPAEHIYRGGYAIEKIFLACSMKIQKFNPLKKVDLIINWQNLTQNTLDVKKYVADSYACAQRLPDFKTFNFFCNDISKRKIGTLHKDIIGYELDLDPTCFNGQAVCKSNGNATHDGTIVQCPIDAASVKSDSVYSFVIDNSFEDEVIDHRVIFIGTILDVYYEKRRPLVNRFSNKNSATYLKKLSDTFSEPEITALNRFCHAMGADYGELDVLRDAKSGKIFVVDFAKTPAGPPNGLSRKDVKKTIEIMSAAFLENIVKPQIYKENKIGYDII